MTKTIHFLFIMLLVLSFDACTAQNQEAGKITGAEQKLNIAKTDTDFDQYFIESKYESAPYGPRSITRNILEDKNGNIWFATWEGIIRYDGATFVNYTNKAKLRRYHVFSLLEDSQGILWFGTIGAGIYRYDGENWLNFTTEDGLPDDRVTCIYEEKCFQSGTIKNPILWFGTTDGASRYDGDTFINFTKEDGMSDDDINSIVKDKNGKLWFGTRGALCSFDSSEIQTEGENKFRIIENENGSTFNNVRSMILDQNGSLWLGGNDGLWRFVGKRFKSYSSEFIGYIYEDKKGNIWTNSAKHGNDMRWKLSRYEAQYPLSVDKNAQIIKENNDMFFGIVEDSNGDIWLGTGYGVYRYDGLSFEHFERK